MPVPGALLLGRQRWDHQQRNVRFIGQLLCELILIVFADTGIQNWIRNGADKIAVVIGSTQPFCRQHLGIHHHHIRQVSKIKVTNLILWVNGQLDFFVPGDVGIAKQGAVIPMLIGDPRRIEAVRAEPVHIYFHAKRQFHKGICFILNSKVM